MQLTPGRTSGTTANANRRPTDAFYLDVSQHKIGTYSRDEVAECISDYHAAEDDEQPPVATAFDGGELQDLQAVRGSNWFGNTSRAYSEYDSEMEYIAQYHHAAEPKTMKSDAPDGSRYPLGEEERVERSGSRKVLPPRNLSEVSRPQVIRDVPVLDYVDKVATPTEPDGKCACRQPECQMTFTSRNKLFAHLQEQLHFLIPKKALAELSVDKWACRKPDCRQMFPTRNKLFAHL